MAEEFPTEAVLAATADLDQRGFEEVVQVIHAEDRRAIAAVGRVLPVLARVARSLARVLERGGRWFNVGAGTSGRMGVMDAAEVPPTFGLSADRVQALLAGGPFAFARAVEGAEDDANAARALLRERRLGSGDAVLAISASGRTPFAIGALAEARACGALALALTCDSHSPLAEAADIAIATEVGPEVIAGSTRMKGGLAQKLVLHTLSTTVMVQLGRVEGNLMTNLKPASQKLRTRAQRILMALAGVDAERASALLDACDGSVQRAIEEARRGGSL